MKPEIWNCEEILANIIGQWKPMTIRQWLWEIIVKTNVLTRPRSPMDNENDLLIVLLLINDIDQWLIGNIEDNIIIEDYY